MSSVAPNGAFQSLRKWLIMSSGLSPIAEFERHGNLLGLVKTCYWVALWEMYDPVFSGLSGHISVSAASFVMKPIK